MKLLSIVSLAQALQSPTFPALQQWCPVQPQIRPVESLRVSDEPVLDVTDMLIPELARIRDKFQLKNLTPGAVLRKDVVDFGHRQRSVNCDSRYPANVSTSILRLLKTADVRSAVDIWWAMGSTMDAELTLNENILKAQRRRHNGHPLHFMNLVTDKVPNQVACARIMCESFMEVVCLFDPGSGYFAFDKDYQGYILKSKFAGEPAPQYSGPFPAIEDLPVFVAASPLRVPGNGPDVLLKPFIFDLKAIMPTVLERDRRSDGTCDAGQQTSLAVCSLVPTCLTAHPPIELQERWIHDVDDAGQTRALLLKKSTCDPSKVHLETTPLGKVKWGKLTLYARYANPDDYDKLEVNLADGAIIVARQQPSKQPAASTSSLTLSPSVSLTMSLSSGPSSLKAEVNGHSYVVHSPRGSVGPSGVAVSPPLVVSILRQFEN